MELILSSYILLAYINTVYQCYHVRMILFINFLFILPINAVFLHLRGDHLIPGGAMVFCEKKDCSANFGK